MTTSTIAFALATHPVHTLFAVIALYHLGARLVGSRTFRLDRPAEKDSGRRLRSAA